jgi:hypothetical protein
LVSIFEAQYGRKMKMGDGSTTQLGQMTDNLNTAFSGVFMFELGVNLLAHWPKAFIHNPWVSPEEFKSRTDSGNMQQKRFRSPISP